MSPFSNLPTEILEDIAFHLLDHDTSSIVPLLQSSKRINAVLAFSNNSHLYSRLFRSTFDYAASARRLGARTHDAPHLAHQLTRYSSALSCIRRGNIYASDDHLLAAFSASFALLTENDAKNRHHLEAAGLPDFVDEFVRKRLYEDCNSSNGWPQESPINSLALWLLWHTSTDERLKAETPARRSEIIKLVLPFVIVPFRYPSAHAPHNHFTMPLTDNSDGHLRQSSIAAHGNFPIYRSDRVLTTHFYDRYEFKIGIPLASTAAKLIFFSRRQVTPIGVPIHLPLNREHAIQLGFADRIGPTQEDVHELNQHKVVNLATPSHDDHGPTTVSPSSTHDDDWYRLTDCIDPLEASSLKNTHYTHGSATGLWQGRLLIPTETAFSDILQEMHLREDFNEQRLFLNAAPIFMRLREYHCIDPQVPVPTGGTNDGFDDGIANAWMPNGVQIREERHAGKLVLNHHGSAYTYEAYHPGKVNSHDEATCEGCLYRGTCDIIYRENDDYLLEGSDDGDADVAMEEEDDARFIARASSQYDQHIDNILAQRGDVMEEDTDVEDADNRHVEYSVQRKCNGVLDIALVGETDYKHGQAWNHYRFYGRVREWDGLVALVRIPAQPQHLTAQGLGVWVFSGYIVGGRNFVGTWRSLGGHDPSMPTLESAFAMTRRDEDGAVHS
ncbi:hypothetical protein K503DRAFT_736495 [Rhizopogon vinicolor AM-OR11-026]|uniref:F-box domain-containing protein n=1 Tax=Rhizopogon vinicolor AM-OR11-026 TaxID=1314800 RepID=A0A1B7N868_9AGAM|nr:hypothetical protein K503DRAFT_736495 [Rhizopogon vinicolor AM-OR11-026]